MPEVHFDRERPGGRHREAVRADLPVPTGVAEPVAALLLEPLGPLAVPKDGGPDAGDRYGAPYVLRRSSSEPYMRHAKPRFPLGIIVATANAVAEVPILSLHAALERHAAGDWGQLSEEDRLANERALLDGERLLSSYETPRGAAFWIITERDRSATTVLLPEDY